MPITTESETELIKQQIVKNQIEITFQNVVYSLTSSLSIIFIGFLAYKIVKVPYNEKEDFSKYLAAVIALLVPFLTYVGQGYIYPKKRRIAVLCHLLRKVDITNDDVKCIYEK